jgi:hypothetical protein
VRTSINAIRPFEALQTFSRGTRPRPGRFAFTVHRRTASFEPIAIKA